MYRILVAEDDDMLQGLLHDVLTGAGFEVTVCPDGGSALKAAVAEAPDLILLDVNLPDRNGFEICAELKMNARTRPIPVVMMTAEAREVVEKVRGLSAGADDYLLKPLSPKVLVARIKSLLSVVAKPKQ